jgi:phospholipase A1
MNNCRNTICLLLLWPCAALPAAAAADALQQCAAIADNATRLKCYDGIAASRGDAPAVQQGSTSIAPAAPAQTAATQDEGLAQLISLPAASGPNQRSYLTRAWNLDGRSDRKNPDRLLPLRPYRQSHLIVRKSSSPNTLPYSPAPGHTATVPAGLDDLEAKFQFSFKAEVMRYRQFHFLGFQNFRLWGAYTQQSNWQAFNTRNSSPFRETNYEPELIATFGTGNAEGLKLVNLGLVHQSNGQSLPLSRSWNRVYLQGGWEWDNSFSLLARAWYRLPENAQQNDNPDIQNYLGHGDVVLRWEPDDTQTVSLLLRNNLHTSQNRGFMQLDWSTPVKIGKSAKLFAQVTDGYGESLIDYNYRQFTYGVGIAFRDW